MDELRARLAPLFMLALVLGAVGCGNGTEVAAPTPTPVPTVPPAPEAHFSAFPISGYVPSEVQFVDDSFGTISDWEWDLDGDGQVEDTVPNPRFTYAVPGSYTVTLSVKGPGGESTETREGYLRFDPAPGATPASTSSSTACVARFALGARPFNRELGGQLVEFTDLSTGGVTAWRWDFDDGSVSTERNPTHLYTQNRVYTVTLTISGPECTGSLSTSRDVSITGCLT